MFLVKLKLQEHIPEHIKNHIWNDSWWHKGSPPDFWVYKERIKHWLLTDWLLQVPVWGDSPGDCLCGVWSEDQQRDEKAAFSEAGVRCKSQLHPKTHQLLLLIYRCFRENRACAVKCSPSYCHKYNFLVLGIIANIFVETLSSISY